MRSGDSWGRKQCAVVHIVRLRAIFDDKTERPRAWYEDCFAADA